MRYLIILSCLLCFAGLALPREPLIPVSGYNRDQVAERFNTFDSAVMTPADIAKTVDAWYSRDITDYSLSGREWALTSVGAIAAKNKEIHKKLLEAYLDS